MNAKQFGAGTETMALGENRQGTGDRADTGVSGLALLAFLSAVIRIWRANIARLLQTDWDT